MMIVPKGYLALPPSEKAEICNGCGAKGGIDVPDTMYGLSVTRACDIHDYMWYVANSVADIDRANEAFYHNMKYLIKQGSWWLRGLRYIRAHTYYVAVRDIGSRSYIKERGF